MPVPEAERFQTGGVLTVSGAHGVHSMYTAFLPTLLPLFIANLGLSKTEAGLLTVFGEWPSVLQPFIGHLSDRFSLRVLFILAPVVTGTIMSLLGLAPSYGVIALGLVVVGLSSACLHATGAVIAGKLSGRSLGRGIGYWTVGGNLGRTLGSVVIVTAIGLLGLKGTPWLMLAGLLIAVLTYRQLRGLPGRPPNAGLDLPGRQVLREMRSLMLPLAVLIVARGFMTSALAIYLPTFLSEEGADLWLAGASLSILEGAGVVGAMLGGSISDRVGRRGVLFASMLATPFLMFLFLAAKGWLRFPLLVAMGFATVATVPVIIALVQESFPENPALANGAYMALRFLLRSGVVVVAGVLGDMFDLRLAFAIGGVLPLLGLPALLLLPGRRSR